MIVIKPGLLIPSRRGFIAGLGASLITAPAIVRASSLMKVKALSDLSPPDWLDETVFPIIEQDQAMQAYLDFILKYLE